MLQFITDHFYIARTARSKMLWFLMGAMMLSYAWFITAAVIRFAGGYWVSGIIYAAMFFGWGVLFCRQGREARLTDEWRERVRNS